MHCKKCGSTNVQVDYGMTEKRNSFFGRFLLLPITWLKWMFFTPIVLIRRLFGINKETKYKQEQIVTCKRCGHIERG